MENRKIESVLSNTSIKNITPLQQKYIELCETVSEIKGHYFKENDFFFNEVLGIGKASCDQSECEVHNSESTWLPTVEQIKELLHSHYLEHLIDKFS